MQWREFDSSIGIFLQKKTLKKTVCTGVLIHPSVVLTAAHCAMNLQSADITLDEMMNDESPRIKVAHWVIHPGYKGNVLNQTIDLSLMFLSRPVEAKVIFPSISNYQKDLVFERIGYGLRHGQNIRTYVTSELFAEYDEYISVRDIYGFPGDSGGPVYQRMDKTLKLVGIHTGRAISPSGSYRDHSYVQIVGNRELVWILKEFKKRRL